MTADELRAYFGLFICMGMVQLPHHYRPRDPLHHPSIVERIQMQHSVRGVCIATEVQLGMEECCLCSCSVGEHLHKRTVVCYEEPGLGTEL